MFKPVEKIESVYFTPDSNAFLKNQIEYLFSLQQPGRGVFYICREEVIDNYFKNGYGENCLVLQYNIPYEKQAKITKLYKDHKGIDGLISSFCTSSDISSDEIINIDYYVGYWNYTKNQDTTISCEFFPCDIYFKKAIFDKGKLEIISKKLPKLNQKRVDNEKVIGLNTLLFGCTLFMPKEIAIIYGSMAFISLVMLLKMEFNLSNKVNELKETQKIIASENFLLAKEIKKEPAEESAGFSPSF